MKDYTIYWRNPETRKFEALGDKWNLRLITINGIPDEFRGTTYLRKHRSEQFTSRILVPGGWMDSR